MAYKTIYTEVEVEVDLDEFDDDELIDELKRRNINSYSDPKEAERLLSEIYYKRVMDKDFTSDLDRYFYLTLGRIV